MRRVIWIKYSKGDFRTALDCFTVRVLDYVASKWITVHWFKHDETCVERRAESGVQCCPGKTRMPDPAPQFYATHAKYVARNQLLKLCRGIQDESYLALEKIYKSPNLCALYLLALKQNGFTPAESVLFKRSPKSGIDECSRLVAAGWMLQRGDSFVPWVSPSASVKSMMIMNAAHSDYATRIGSDIGVIPTKRPLVGAPDDSVKTESLGRLWRRYK